MGEDLLELLLATDVEALFLVASLNMVRLLGLTFGFLAFSWGVGQSVLLRISISIALSLPVLVMTLPEITRLSREASQLQLALLLPKEFALGLGMGVLASAPFRALQYAGAVTDAFRGENNSGLQDPSGGQTTTTPVAYVVVGLFVFVATGGLWQLVAMIYRSFLVWPVDRLLPPLSSSSAILVGEMMQRGFVNMMLIAAPLLILLFLVELACYGGAKLGRRMGVYELAFPMKNLVATASLPLIFMLIHRSSGENVSTALDALDLTRMFLR